MGPGEAAGDGVATVSTPALLSASPPGFPSPDSRTVVERRRQRKPSRSGHVAASPPRLPPAAGNRKAGLRGAGGARPVLPCTGQRLCPLAPSNLL